MLVIIQNISVYIIWPVLVLSSAIIFIKGFSSYRLVKDSMIGKITKALVYTTLVNISSLGIISTLYIFSNPDNIYLVLAVFVIWFIIFIWSLKVLRDAERETKKITGTK